MTMFERLAAPFPAEAISWRVGSTTPDKSKGMALAYLDARDVMERLDDACTPIGWQNRYSHVGGVTVCEIGLRVSRASYRATETGGMELLHPGEWLWKADGAGATDIEAEKGALSDAFKRAAVRWGIGQYLYSLPSPWVELDGRKIKETEYKKLADLHEHHASTIEWGTPAERATLRSLCNVAKQFLKTPADVREFRENSEGEMKLLRVKARAHLDALLSRIADGTEYEKGEAA